MMWLLTAWGGVKRLYGIAVAYPLQAALIVAVAASLWLWSGKQDALATIAKRDATITQMAAASKIATAVQLALNKAVTDKQTEIARLTDADETNRRDIANRSSDYAERMSAKNYCRKANPTPQDSDTESGIRPSADAVVVERKDFDILTGNTARLLDVKAWADRLIGEGLAVPVE